MIYIETLYQVKKKKKQNIQEAYNWLAQKQKYKYIRIEKHIWIVYIFFELLRTTANANIPITSTY